MKGLNYQNLLNWNFGHKQKKNPLKSEFDKTIILEMQSTNILEYIDAEFELKTSIEYIDAGFELKTSH